MMSQPLAERMRPKTLDEYIGQTHLVGKDAVLRKMIEAGHVPSFILWGPPGVGKTTLAQIVARQLQAPFYTLSAVSSGVKEVREVIEKAKGNRFFDSIAPILFIDEIHRFSKSQQDSLLNAVETGVVTLIGATTENPSFEVIRPLLSRCQVYVLKSLGKQDLLDLLHRALTEDVELKEKQVVLTETDALLRYSGGDARKLLNILELVVSAEPGQGRRDALRHYFGLHQVDPRQRSGCSYLLVGPYGGRRRRPGVYCPSSGHFRIGGYRIGQSQRFVAGKCLFRCVEEDRLAGGSDHPD